jgi:hypothetical protein
MSLFKGLYFNLNCRPFENDFSRNIKINKRTENSNAPEPEMAEIEKEEEVAHVINYSSWPISSGLRFKSGSIVDCNQGLTLF